MRRGLRNICIIILMFFTIIGVNSMFDCVNAVFWNPHIERHEKYNIMNAHKYMRTEQKTFFKRNKGDNYVFSPTLGDSKQVYGPSSLIIDYVEMYSAGKDRFLKYNGKTITLEQNDLYKIGIYVTKMGYQTSEKGHYLIIMDVYPCNNIEKRETKNTAPVVLRNGKATKVINLREYLRDAKGELVIDKESSSDLGIKIINNSSIEVSAKKVGKYKLVLKNNREASKYKGSSTKWIIHVKKPSSSNSSSINSKPSSSSSGSSTINSKPTVNVPQYNPYMNLECKVSNYDAYTTSKKATLTMKKNDMKDDTIKVTVNGKSSGKVNVKGGGSTYTFDITKNDYYIVNVTGYGRNGKKITKSFPFNINTIDNKAPKCSNFNIKRTKGKNKVKLNLTVKDETNLASVDVYNPNGSKLQTINASGKEKTITTQEVDTQGKYKFVIKDKVGNSYTYKTSTVKIDSKAPSIKSFAITKKSSKTGNASTEEKGVEKILASTGDTITLKIWTDEYLSKNPEVYIQGQELGKISGVIKRSKAKSKNGWYLTTVTFKMSGAIEKSKDVPILIKGLRDEWGNVSSGIKKYENKLYYDVSSPLVKNITIKASTSSGKAISGLCKQLTDKNTIEIAFTTHEILGKDTTVTMAGVSNKIKASSGKKVNGGYRYTTKFKLNSKQLENLPKGIQEIKISNLVDRAGNVTKSETYKKDSSNNYILYGDIITGGIYIEVSRTNEIVANKPLGDINGDGYITSYDYLLLYRYLNDKIYANGKKEETYKDEVNDYDINKDGKIDSKDLEKIIKLVKNSSCNMDSNGLNIKLYDINNNLIKGDELDKTNWLSSKVTQEIVNKEEGIINIKVQDKKGGMPGLVTYNNCLGNIRLNIIEKVTQEEGGYITVQSKGLSYKRQLFDFNNDGAITGYDGAIIQNYTVNGFENNQEMKKYIEENCDVDKSGKVDIKDITYMQKALRDIDSMAYNNIIKDDSIELKYILGKSGSQFEENIDSNKISWESLNPEIATVQKNEDGTATVKAVGNVGEQTQILGVYTEKTEDKEETKYCKYNLKISDLGINMVKTTEEGEQQEENVKEIYLSKEKNETAKLQLYVEDIQNENNNVEWKVENEEIVTATVDENNIATIIPNKTGTTNITATTTLNGIQYVAETEISVDNNIKKVSIMHDGEALSGTLKLKPTDIYDFSIKTEPEDVSESCQVSVEDNSILSISETDNGYSVTALEEGKTNIIVEAQNGTVEFPVEVNTNSNPTIRGIYASDTTKNYKTNDNIELVVEFDQNIKGDVPDIKLYFDEEEASGEYEGNIVDNKIIYKYKVGKDDNGQLYIGDIVLGEDKSLTDSDGIAVADLSKETLYADNVEVIPESENVEDSSNDEESNNNENTEEVSSDEQDGDEGQEQEYDEEKYLIKDIYILQKVPTLETSLITSNNSNAIKDGDSVTLYMEASTELKENPIVVMGGNKVQVNKEDLTYSAELKITKDTVKEGILDVKVDKFEDKYGNIGEAFNVNSEDYGGDAIVVDYTAPEIDRITYENYTNNSKVGDKIQIKVTFADKTKGETELIQLPEKEENGSTVYEFPKLVLSFDGKEAKGELTANYLKEDNEVVEEEKSQDNNTIYSDTIVYTYTLTDKDKGELTLNSLKGTVFDMAENKSELDYNSDINEYVKDNENNQQNNNKQNENNQQNNNKQNENNQQNNNKQDENNQQNNEKDNLASKKLPYTGIAIKTGIFVVIAMLAIVVIKRIKINRL